MATPSHANSAERSPGPSPEPVTRARAVALLAGSVAALAGVWALGLRGVEPVATWFYPFAWCPLLLALEAAYALRSRRFFALHAPAALPSLLLWSVPIWMLFELLNLRLENWYYVFVPSRRPLAWIGIVISFATVLPAVLIPSALVAELAGWRSPGGPSDGRPGRSSPGLGPRPEAMGSLLRATPAVGFACLALPLLWPRYFFPLVWVAFLLVVDPVVLKRDPARSLVADALARRWRRILALLGGGAAAGLFWESLNVVARGRWIYTVPGLEELKLFEMPPLGFLGFPVFTLSAFALYQWLVVQGVAAPIDIVGGWHTAAAGGVGGSRESAPERPEVRSATGPGRAAAALAPVVVVLGLAGLEARTITSRTPALRDLPGLLPSDVEDLTVWGISTPFALAALVPDSLMTRVPLVDADEAERWIASARLATLRGIGTRSARSLHAFGVTSVEELADARWQELVRCFEDSGGPRVRPVQIRIWIRAAGAHHPEGRSGSRTLPCAGAGASP